MHHRPLIFSLSILALASLQGLAAPDVKNIEDLQIVAPAPPADKPIESNTSPAIQQSPAKLPKASPRSNTIKLRMQRQQKESWRILNQEEKQQLAQYLIEKSGSNTLPSNATKPKEISHKKLIEQIDKCIHSNDEGSYQEKKILLRNCLFYLQREAPAKAYTYINSLKLWQHSEHFLERTPYFLLEQLAQGEWLVDIGLLKKALYKLEKLIPIDIDDGITCYAGRPMDKILKLIYLQEGTELRQQLEIYSKSIDEDLSYSSNSLLLRMYNLPQINIEELLEEHWEIEKAKDLKKLSKQQRDIAVLIASDLGLRRANFPTWLGVEEIQRAALLLEELGLKKHAQVLLSLLLIEEKNKQSSDEHPEEDSYRMQSDKDAIINASIIYNTLTGSYPANIIARRILKEPSIAKIP